MNEQATTQDEPWGPWFDEQCDEGEDYSLEDDVGASDLSPAWPRLAVMLSVGLVAVFAVLAIS
jgi:hypothetical protein